GPRRTAPPRPAGPSRGLRGPAGARGGGAGAGGPDDSGKRGTLLGSPGVTGFRAWACRSFYPPSNSPSSTVGTLTAAPRRFRIPEPVSWTGGPPRRPIRVVATVRPFP